MRHVLNGWCRVFVVGVCVLGVLGSVRLRAQAQVGVAALTGTVSDPNGNPVANAAVIVRNPLVGSVATATSDASGHFSITGLPAGLYAVEVSTRGFATFRRDSVKLAAGRSEDLAVTLSLAQITEDVIVSGDIPAAARNAPSQGSLLARSAQSHISEQFIRDYTSPVADFSQVIQMAPGTFSVAANGVGLGDTKTFFRGFKDGQYSMTFDGIPFNDTNDPTHHSWAFFPTQFLGGTVFDRSPGSAATIGPATYGGSINLLSRNLEPDQHIRGSASYGSFSTRLVDAEYDSGQLGAAGRSRLLLDVHQLNSDGYQTFNTQKRDAFSGKYQYDVTDGTTLTLFSAVVDVHANTPNVKGPTRAQVAQFGANYLLSSDQTQPNYFGYNFYHIPTDFEYGGVKSDLGHGWSLDDKVYTVRYYNKQNYNGSTISPTSATDKLNSYRKYGNLLPLSQTSDWGVFRTGLWSEYAMTDRFQAPSDPRTWVDATLPNFHEKFNTTTLQPYAEYELKVTSDLSITPGIKFASYAQDFTQFADNGKTVGNLNGAPSITHSATYQSWLPSLDAHYLLRKNWSVYGQYGKGNTIPPTSVFDVKGAQVLTLPRPTTTVTYQVGSTWKSDRFTFDMDTYHIRFDSDYSSAPDPATGEPVYFLAGTSVTKGVEAEGNILLGGGLGLYLNGTLGSAKYSDSGLWVQNAPRDTETVGVSFQQGSWSVGAFNKRVGRMFNDNGSTHEAVAIDPFNTANLFVNYTLKGSSHFRQTRLRLSVNNLTDSHAITGVAPASTKTSVASPGDFLTLMPGRSVAFTVTIDFAGR